jgi:hypothetical protein
MTNGGNSIRLILNRTGSDCGVPMNGHAVVTIGDPSTFIGICVKAVCKERIKWVEKRESHVLTQAKVHRNGHNEFVTRHTSAEQSMSCTGKKILFYAQSNVMMEGTFAKGIYVVPFTFTFPAGLPGTIDTTGTRDDVPFSLNCFYKLKGSFLTAHGSKSTIRDVLPVDISQPKHDLTAKYSARNSLKVSSLGCIPRGHLLVRLLVEKPSVSPGDRLLLRACVLNHSSKRVTQIVAKLRRQVEILSDTNSLLIVEDEVCETQLDPLRPKQSLSDHDFELRVPEEAPQMSIGVLLKCYYFVRLSARVSSGHTVSCVAPVFIYAKPSVNGVVSRIDPTARVMEPVTLVNSAPIVRIGNLANDSFPDHSGFERLDDIPLQTDNY